MSGMNVKGQRDPRLAPLCEEMRINPDQIQRLGGIDAVERMTPLGRELMAAMIHAPRVSKQRIREHARDLQAQWQIEKKVKSAIRTRLAKRIVAVRPPQMPRLPKAKPMRAEDISLDRRQIMRVQKMMQLAERAKVA
jgi:hypothetical protein